MDILGFIFGLCGFSFALMAHKRISKLEEKLKELSVIDQEFDSGEKP
ncbi:hypothetical protein [Thalassotalea sp. PS06]|nr:hypothetical protein [Thalassotalea sp. PS06]